MSSKKFFLRLLPFFATFLVGIFIASFFVTIGRPGFGGRRARHFHEDQQMRVEMDRLRDENIRLTEQLNEIRMNRSGWDRTDSDIIEAVPPPPIPMQPSAPRAIR
jgi:hypothetical protein